MWRSERSILLELIAGNRETNERLERIEHRMADITALTAAVDQLDADEAAGATAISGAVTTLNTSIATLTATIAALEVGQPITQVQIDQLTAGVTQADTGLGTLVASVVPVVTP